MRDRARRLPAPAAVGALAACALAACGGGPASGGAGDGRLQVVTTVSPITNIVANIAGGLTDVEGIVPEGANSHGFEPAPRVARTLARADVVFVNGLGLDVPTTELARANRKDGAEIVELGARTLSRNRYVYDFSFPRDRGRPNPHLWTDPPLAKRYAELVRDTLAGRDPAHASAYASHYRRYAAQVDALDSALRAATATVPVQRRRLLTYHDSFPYFAREYGWKVVGAIQPSDFAEPTPKDVARLIAQVSSEGVPAIFGSEVFPSPVLDRIADESGARYVDDLRDDDLPGGEGGGEHSLVGLLRFDYSTIVEALGGRAGALRAVSPGNAVGDEARYAE